MSPLEIYELTQAQVECYAGGNRKPQRQIRLPDAERRASIQRGSIAIGTWVSRMHYLLISRGIRMRSYVLFLLLSVFLAVFSTGCGKSGVQAARENDLTPQKILSVDDQKF